MNYDENEYLDDNANNDNLEYYNSNLSSNRRNNVRSINVPKRLQQISGGHTYRNTRNNKLGSNTNNGNEASKNIQNNKNSADNLKNKLLKNKTLNNSLLGRFKKKKNDSEVGEQEGNTASHESNEEDNGLGGIVKVAKKIRNIKLALSLLGFIMPFLLIIILLLAAGSIVSTQNIGKSLKNYGTSILGSNSEMNRYEKEYSEKMRELMDYYTEKYGDDKVINYINAALIYYYYEGGADLDNENTDVLGVNYQKMSDMVDTVKNLVPESSNIDYSINGEFYNNLKNSSEFRNYYNSLLTDKTMDDVLNEIFELAPSLDIKNDFQEDTFISTETKVNLDKDGKTVNMQSINTNKNSGNGSNSNNTDTSLTFKNYLLGVIYANVENSILGQDEKIKALVIAYTTNIMAKNNLVLNSQIVTINNKEYAYCNAIDGCSYTKNNQLQSGPGERENGNNVLYGGKYYYKAPLSSSMINHLDSIINEVYGNVLTNDEGSFSYLDISKVNRIDVTNYKDMLSRAYPELTLKNIIENNYANDLDYGPRKVATEVIFYEQRDYSDTPFCHRKSNSLDNSIGKAGCGITAMAIVASTYENSRKYDPIYMNERAYQLGQCGSSDGTFTGFFGRQARAMGYQHLSVGTKKNSDKQQVLNHLSQGHLIVARMGRGMFTNSGHYIVLSGIDPATKKVYVHDPYNRINKKIHNSGNGWYSFNSIVKQAKEFYIIWKG